MDFVLLYFVIGLEYLGHFLKFQSKLGHLRFPVCFIYASGSLFLVILSSHQLLVTFPIALIALCDTPGVVLTALNRGASQRSHDILRLFSTERQLYRQFFWEQKHLRAQTQKKQEWLRMRRLTRGEDQKGETFPHNQRFIE